MRVRSSLADILSIQRASEGHGRNLHVAVEHFGVIHEAGKVVVAEMGENSKTYLGSVGR